mmetsp:Transcript_4676/g.4817  ORF Transcript_4676/g.4817 Transcript_4676/m.4817 type:complete len:349 (-) Transcript_4676:77-1123(-)
MIVFILTFLHLFDFCNPFIYAGLRLHVDRWSLKLSEETSNEEEITAESKSAFDAIFDKLNFQYERQPDKADGLTKSNSDGLVKSNYKSQIKSQNALCYSGERQRGCQTLLNNDSLKEEVLENIQMRSLPCVTDGTCPYSQFRCTKGHIWKAVNGSPVCFHCPVCESSRKITGRKQEATAERLLNSLKMHAISNGGSLVSTSLDDSNKWSCLVAMTCVEGHNWTGKVGNILLNKTGCFQCALMKKRYGEKEMHDTATHFGGIFLGFLDDGNLELNGSNSESYTKVHTRSASWRCSEGHTFTQIAGNIRRPPGGKRKCSWCKECRRTGVEFKWISPRDKLVKNGTMVAAG